MDLHAEPKANADGHCLFWVTEESYLNMLRRAWPGKHFCYAFLPSRLHEQQLYILLQTVTK